MTILADRRKDSKMIVRFEGGIGAQIMAAAAYFALEREGHPTFADLTYFDYVPRVARVSKRRPRISIWKWELQNFSLNESDFRVLLPSEFLGLHGYEYLTDGNPRKLIAALKGLQSRDIRNMFSTPVNPSAQPQARSTRATGHKAGAEVALHIRRGDYLNVADRITSYERYLECIEKFEIEGCKVTVFSDSRLPLWFIVRLRRRFRQVVFVGPKTASAFETHYLLRSSDLMIGSNSQFSLVAALLGEGRAYLPVDYRDDLVELSGELNLKLPIEWF